MPQLYHVMHICLCEECKGRRWSHSQGDWDAHLRFVPSHLVVDVPTVEDEAEQERLIRECVARRLAEIGGNKRRESSS